MQGDSEWTESLWGDERLFFSHISEVDDIRDHRKVLQRTGGKWWKKKKVTQFNDLVVSQLPRFDFDKYGSPFK